MTSRISKDVQLRFRSTGASSAQKDTQQVESGFSKLQATVVSVQSAISLAERGVQLLGKAFEQAKLGAQVRDVEAAFGKLGGSALILSDITAALNGTVSSDFIRRQFNMARTLGIQAEQFAKLTEIAKAAAGTLGIDVKFALESVVVGVARGSKLWLDNLGIIADVDKHQQLLAGSLGKTRDALSEAEKKQAFFNATVEAGNKIIARSPIESHADAYAQLSAAAENAANSIRKGLGEDSSGLVGSVTTLFEAFRVGMEGFAETAADIPGSVGEITARMRELERAFPDLEDTPTNMGILAPAVGSVAHEYNLLSDALAENVRIMSMQEDLLRRVEDDGLLSGLGSILDVVSTNSARFNAELAEVNKSVEEFGRELIQLGTNPAVQAAVSVLTLGRVDTGRLAEQARTVRLPAQTITAQLPRRASRGGDAARARSRRDTRAEAEAQAQMDFDADLAIQQMELEEQGLLLDSLGAQEAALRGVQDEAAKAKTGLLELAGIEINAPADSIGFLNAKISELNKGVAEAAVGALFLGDSFSEALNQVFKGIFKEAAVLALMELAKGVAAQATTWGVPNPSAILHYKAAGMFGLIAGGAAIGASATGGLKGGGGGGGGGGRGSAGGRGRSGGPTRSEFGPSSADGQITTVINVNLSGRQIHKEVVRQNAEVGRGNDRFSTVRA